MTYFNLINKYPSKFISKLQKNPTTGSIYIYTKGFWSNMVMKRDFSGLKNTAEAYKFMMEK